MGGVESHIYQLSQCLIERGHKVRYLPCAQSVFRLISNFNKRLALEFDCNLPYCVSDTACSNRYKIQMPRPYSCTVGIGKMKY